MTHNWFSLRLCEAGRGGGSAPLRYFSGRKLPNRVFSLVREYDKDLLRFGRVTASWGLTRMARSIILSTRRLHD